MKYDWHKEYYEKALKTIVNTAGIKYAGFRDLHGDQAEGWLEFFRRSYPDIYKRYAETMAAIVKLWGKKDSESQEAWKVAVKKEVEAMQWIVNRYVEHYEKAMHEARLSGTQVALV